MPTRQVLNQKLSVSKMDIGCSLVIATIIFLNRSFQFPQKSRADETYWLNYIVEGKGGSDKNFRVSTIYHSTTRSKFTLIYKKLQNRAARVLTFSSYDCSTSELFQNLKWSKLVHQRAVGKAIMRHSIVNNTAPEYLTSRFVRRCDLTSYNLRENEYKLAVPQPRTEFNKRSLSYSGSVLWNSLSLEVRQLTSPSIFKGKLRGKFRLTINLISDILFLHTASMKSRCFLFIFIILVFRLVRQLVFSLLKCNIPESYLTLTSSLFGFVHYYIIWIESRSLIKKCLNFKNILVHNTVTIVSSA